MEFKNEQPDVFYLGFNKDTGSLVEVIPPKGREVTLHPEQICRINLGKMKAGEKKRVLEQLKWLNELLKENALPPINVIFVDLPGNSVCGGSCGGIPFCFC